MERKNISLLNIKTLFRIESPNCTKRCFIRIPRNKLYNLVILNITGSHDFRLDIFQIYLISYLTYTTLDSIGVLNIVRSLPTVMMLQIWAQNSDNTRLDPDSIKHVEDKQNNRINRLQSTGRDHNSTKHKHKALVMLIWKLSYRSFYTPFLLLGFKCY